MEMMRHAAGDVNNVSSGDLVPPAPGVERAAPAQHDDRQVVALVDVWRLSRGQLEQLESRVSAVTPRCATDAGGPRCEQTRNCADLERPTACATFPDQERSGAGTAAEEPDGERTSEPAGERDRSTRLRVLAPASCGTSHGAVSMPDRRAEHNRVYRRRGAWTRRRDLCAARTFARHTRSGDGTAVVATFAPHA
jgi:hypothetical protein